MSAGVVPLPAGPVSALEPCFRDAPFAATIDRVITVGVLGSLLVAGPGGPVHIGSKRQRRLLAALVAHPDGAAVDRLVDLMWIEGRDPPPADPGGSLHTYVARLRRSLPPSVRLGTTATGYRLEVPRDQVDVTAFSDLVAAAGERHDAAHRLGVLQDALLLWRGRPYAELDHPDLAPEVARLERLHGDALEQRAAALLATGRAAAAAAAAESVVAADPLREGAVEVLATALVATGRQADALAVLSRLRRRLADELGLDPGPRLQELERQVLRQELAPRARAVPVPRPGSDPVPRAPVSSFVGRQEELQRVVALLPRRVVTVCGPGGVGKTRLARQVLAARHAHYDDGALFVELGAGGPHDVEPAVAAALRLADGGSAPLGERIVSVLAVRRQLLVLDNCEHAADEVASLVERICLGAPGVDLLLTSREPLRVDGEQLVRLSPLPPGDARRLLSDRIRSAGPARARDPAEAALAAELCRRLDGLPLALELAAARAATVGLRELLDTLGEPAELHLDALGRGRRTAGSRHRSLRDVVEWSFGLLDDEQRRLFVRLGVFAGPVDQQAVTAVCGTASALPDLVDRSLVECIDGRDGRPVRYGMLQTLRAFCRGRLATDRGGAGLRARHAAWAVQVAGELLEARRGPGEAAAVHRFDDLLPELRRAHAWLCGSGAVEDLLRLSLPLGEMGWLRCRVDLVELVDRALEVAGAGNPGGSTGSGTAARLLGLLATADWQRGDLVRAERRARRAIEVAAAADDEPAAGVAYEALANVHNFRGELAAAREAATHAVALAAAAGDDELAMLARLDLLLAAAYGRSAAEADAQESAMAVLADRLGSPTAVALREYGRGERRAEAGDPAAAGHLAAAVRAAESVDGRFLAGVARHTLLTSATRGTGDPSLALAGLHRLVDHWHRVGAWTQLWVAVRAVVDALSRLGRHEDAGRLLGALRASSRATPPFGADAVREAAVERTARAALGWGGFAAAIDAGAALGDAGAVALALRVTRPGVAAGSVGNDSATEDPVGRLAVPRPASGRDAVAPQD